MVQVYSQEKAEKALTALLGFIDKKQQNADGTEKKDLLADDEEDAQSLYLTIATKKYLTDKKQLKPKLITLPNPIRSIENTTICVFTKDPQRAYKDVLMSDESATHGLVSKVVGVSKLKGKHKAYQNRRSLLSAHNLFISEDSVVTTLPKLLGKVFYGGSVNHYPVSVKLTNKEGKIDASVAKKEIEKVINSTAFVLAPGATASIVVGKSTQSVKEITENVSAVLEQFAKNIRNEEGIRSVNIKGRSTPSLPIYFAETLYNDKDDAAPIEAAADEEDKKRKRDPSQLTDFEQALTEQFDEEAIEKFTNKKLKKGEDEDEKEDEKEDSN